MLSHCSHRDFSRRFPLVIGIPAEGSGVLRLAAALDYGSLLPCGPQDHLPPKQNTEGGTRFWV